MKKLTTKQLTLFALILSLNIILQGTLKIDFGSITQYGFSFIPSALSGIIFGPIYGFVGGVIADIISFFTFPSPYPFFAGYTLTSGLGPLLYALCLHKKLNKPLAKQLHKYTSIIRIFLVVLIITVFLNIGLGTLWISMMNGKSYIALLYPRLIKNVISLFLNTFILSTILNTPFIQKLIKTYEL